MRIEHKDMKSCFTCLNADYFILPNKALFDYKDINVLCLIDIELKKLLAIGPGCPNYKPCCDHSIVLKEN